MRELKNETLFPRQSTTVTIQCSGTRRIEQIHEYPGDGDELINAPVRSHYFQRTFLLMIFSVGRRRYRNRKMDRRLPQKSNQVLRWTQRPLLSPSLRIPRRRHLLQKRRSLQLRRLGTLAQSQNQRSAASMGNERRAFAENPRVPSASCSFWLHWREIL